MVTRIERVTGSVIEVFETATKRDLDRWCSIKLVDHDEHGRRYIIPFTAIGQITQEVS